MVAWAEDRWPPLSTAIDDRADLIAVWTDTLLLSLILALIDVADAEPGLAGLVARAPIVVRILWIAANTIAAVVTALLQRALNVGVALTHRAFVLHACMVCWARLRRAPAPAGTA